MDFHTKILVVYIVEVWLCETLAFIAGILYHNNLLIYHIFSVLQFLLICFYFHHCIRMFQRYYIAIAVGITGLIFGVINGVYLQPNQVNSNYLLFQCIAVITMTLISFYELLAGDDDDDLTKQPQFWASCFLLIFWSFTFAYWLIQIIDPSVRKLFWTGVLVNGVNIACYGGFGLLFLTFRKRKLA
jgi:hypothetical protein